MKDAINRVQEDLAATVPPVERSAAAHRQTDRRLKGGAVRLDAAGGRRRVGVDVAAGDVERARIAFKASATPAPSSSRMRRVSPSRCNSLAASAARISAVRCACACLQTASRDTPKRSAAARFESPVAIAEINLRPRRVIADRAAQPDGPLHRSILMG